MSLGTPRVHLRSTDSTNLRARELATRGAPHGTLVTAGEQSAGRGRQGRTWSAPAGRALLCSLVVRDPPELVPLMAGIAVAEVAEGQSGPGVSGGSSQAGEAGPGVGGAGSQAGEAGPGVGGAGAQLKWPNDVLIGGRKVAGILVEGRLQERWAVVGIGLNVALREQDFPPELRGVAGTLGREPNAIEPTLERLLRSLERWLAAEQGAVLGEVRSRDALLGQRVHWADGEGVGAGVDDEGQLLVDTVQGRVALRAGEVHLARVQAP